MESSIMYRDPELEASFSVNLSALHVFSDDDDDEEEDEEYIEISLEQQPINNFNNDDDGGDDDDGSPQELFELQISFGLSRTSTVESLGNEWATPTPASSSSSSSSSTSTLSCSSAATTCWAVDHQPSVTHNHKATTVERRVQFRAVNRLFNGLFSCPMTLLSEHGGKMTKATNNGGGMMMNFLIKFRSVNIRAVVASPMKPYQKKISSSQRNHQRKKKKKKKRSNGSTTLQSLLVKPFDKGLHQGYGGDSSSIQAAIAHCKRSFVQTSCNGP